MQKNKKSPITSKPLRYAGQSLDEHIDGLLNDKGMLYIVYIGAGIILLSMEWWRYYNPITKPIITSFIYILIIVFSAYKLVQIVKQVKKLRLGRDGERAVGQYLENLREKGYRIFHDILGESFNLDHVIISKKGIYVIETKTYSKPVRGKTEIEYNGSDLLINRKILQNKPLVQVQSASKWLENILLESTGKKFNVKPVVLFPGWCIKPLNEGNKSEIWVLNPKALPTFIDNQVDVLSCEDMKLACFHISRFIRTCK